MIERRVLSLNSIAFERLEWNGIDCCFSGLRKQKSLVQICEGVLKVDECSEDDDIEMPLDKCYFWRWGAGRCPSMLIVNGSA